MERTFFPSREYWFVHLVEVSCWAAMIGGIIFLTQLEGEPVKFRWHTSAALWWFLAIGAVYLATAAVYSVLTYRHKRMVIRKEEVRSHGPLLVRAIRFADVIDVHWLWPIRCAHPVGLRLRTPTRNLVIYFDHFVQWEAQNELLDLIRGRLGPSARQDWDRIQALREGRAFPWSPPVFSVKKIARMVAAGTALALVTGVALGFLLQIRIPGAAAWWASAARSGTMGLPGPVERILSGRLLLDWSLGSGFLGLMVGSLFLSLFWFLEWSGLKWRMIQARRLERAISPPPDSRGV